MEPAIVERLAPIWRRVLKRPLAELEDNFFEPGGDPAAAVELFRVVAEVFNRQLQPITIYQAPTLRKLANLLNHPEPPAFPPVVLMKAGTDPPVFLTHGVGGSLMELFHLTMHIQAPNSLYGIQAQGFDGKSEPLSRVEDMAQAYVKAVKEVQPRGPYAFIGYSFGGLVVYEMARQLVETGETIALLALAESYPHGSQWPFAERMRTYTKVVRGHALVLSRLPWQERSRYLMKGSRLRVQLRNDYGIEQITPFDGWLPAPALERYQAGQSLAWRSYRPGFYKGKVNLLRAETRSHLLPGGPTAFWTELADECEVELVPGDHFGIVTTHYETLAYVLSGHVKAAFQNKRK